MNPTLFDSITARRVERTPDVSSWPRARASDPKPSHDAAARAKRGSSDLVGWVRACVRESMPYPMTAFDIARVLNDVHPGRWDEGTIRTAVSRAGLRVVDEEGVSPRGSRVRRYAL